MNLDYRISVRDGEVLIYVSDNNETFKLAAKGDLAVHDSVSVQADSHLLTIVPSEVAA